MQFKDRILAGLSGEYQGLSNGFDRINDYIYNVQRSTYYLLGGLSGASKTTLVDFIILNALEDAESKNIPINIDYYSWEINEATKKANWLSVMIYKKYGIVISPQKIKGLGKLRLTEDEQKIVFDELPNLERLFSKIKWHWVATNPTGLYNQWWAEGERTGTFIKEPYIDDDGKKQEKVVGWIPNDPTTYSIKVVDHLANAKLERGFNLKQNIDKISEYAVICRNLFKMSFFFVQQFNQGLSSVDRLKFKGADISPQQSDFKDTTNPYTDADIVLGIMNAYKMDLETNLNYNINVEGFPGNLKGRYRLLKVIKNRDGADSIAIGLYTKPEAGYFEELPKEMTSDDYTYYLNK